MAAAVLVEESRAATMIVLGDRGLGGFTGLLVGSVAVQLAAHAHCPFSSSGGGGRPPAPSSSVSTVRPKVRSR
jgi:hypothetical protein